MDIDTSTAMGEAMLRILAALAELRLSMIRGDDLSFAQIGRVLDVEASSVR